MLGVVVEPSVEAPESCEPEAGAVVSAPAGAVAPEAGAVVSVPAAGAVAVGAASSA